MRITSIEVYPLRGSRPSGHDKPCASFVTEGSIVIRVGTDEGLTGLGEPSPYGGSLAEIKKILSTRIKVEFIGRDPFAVAALTRQPETHGPSGYGRVPYHCALAGMSQALWDIVGKARGLPLYRLLDPTGSASDRVRAYASGGMFFSWDDPQVLVDEALALSEQGFSAWKLRPPTPGAASHLERNRRPPPVDQSSFLTGLAHLRAVVGDRMELMVDGGCRFADLGAATEAARAMQDLGFSFFEEPLPRVPADYAALAAAVDLPIAGGESLVSRDQYAPWLEAGAYDLVQPDGNLAGVTEVLAIAAQADGKGLGCVIHNWANDVSIAANVHLAAALPNCALVEYNTTYNPLRTVLVDEPFVPRNGFFSLPEKPGLGIELNEDALRHFACEASV